MVSRYDFLMWRCANKGRALRFMKVALRLFMFLLTERSKAALIVNVRSVVSKGLSLSQLVLRYGLIWLVRLGS